MSVITALQQGWCHIDKPLLIWLTMLWGVRTRYYCWLCVIKFFSKWRQLNFSSGGFHSSFIFEIFLHLDESSLKLNSITGRALCLCHVSRLTYQQKNQATKIFCHSEIFTVNCSEWFDVLKIPSESESSERFYTFHILLCRGLMQYWKQKLLLRVISLTWRL